MGRPRFVQAWVRQRREERKLTRSNGLYTDPYDWVWYGYISKKEMDEFLGKNEPVDAQKQIEEWVGKMPEPKQEQQQDANQKDKEGERCPVGKIIDFEESK